MNNQRLEYLDLAKAIAIISVVAGHVLLYDLYGGKHIGNAPLMGFVGSYHNFLFIFLSGLVSITSIELSKVGRDIYKRFRKLIVPALAIGIPYTIFYGDVSTFFVNEWKWGYWYLFVLFELYILTYPIALFNKHYEKNGFWVYALVMILWGVINRHLYVIPQVIRDTFSMDLMFRMLPFYILGNACKKYGLHSYLFNKYSLVITLTTWFATQYIQQGYFYLLQSDQLRSNYFMLHSLQFAGDYINVFFILVRIICIISLCKIIAEWKPKGYSTLSYIGRNTLYIYILHYFTMQWMAMPSLYEWFNSKSCLAIDIVAVIIPTAIATAFSLVLAKLANKSDMLMKLVFYNK